MVLQAIAAIAGIASAVVGIGATVQGIGRQNANAQDIKTSNAAAREANLELERINANIRGFTKDINETTGEFLDKKNVLIDDANKQINLKNTASYDAIAVANDAILKANEASRETSAFSRQLERLTVKQNLSQAAREAAIVSARTSNNQFLSGAGRSSIRQTSQGANQSQLGNTFGFSSQQTAIGDLIEASQSRESTELLRAQTAQTDSQLRQLEAQNIQRDADTKLAILDNNEQRALTRIQAKIQLEQNKGQVIKERAEARPIAYLKSLGLDKDGKPLDDNELNSLKDRIDAEQEVKDKTKELKSLTEGGAKELDIKKATLELEAANLKSNRASDPKVIEAIEKDIKEIDRVQRLTATRQQLAANPNADPNLVERNILKQRIAKERESDEPDLERIKRLKVKLAEVDSKIKSGVTTEKVKPSVPQTATPKVDTTVDPVTALNKENEDDRVQRLTEKRRELAKDPEADPLKKEQIRLRQQIAIELAKPEDEQNKNRVSTLQDKAKEVTEEVKKSKDKKPSTVDISKATKPVPKPVVNSQPPAPTPIKTTNTKDKVVAKTNVKTVTPTKTTTVNKFENETPKQRADRLTAEMQRLAADPNTDPNKLQLITVRKRLAVELAKPVKDQDKKKIDSLKKREQEAKAKARS